MNKIRRRLLKDNFRMRVLWVLEDQEVPLHREGCRCYYCGVRSWWAHLSPAYRVFSFWVFDSLLYHSRSHHSLPGLVVDMHNPSHPWRAHAPTSFVTTEEE